MSSSAPCDIQDQSQRQITDQHLPGELLPQPHGCSSKKTSPFPPSGNSGRWKGVYYSKKEGTVLTCCH